jgi:cyclic dehypoxanthinyl futalosine synthase
MGISREQALEYCGSDDLIGIGMEADAMRRKLHPEGVVSYLVDRAIRYTAPDLDAKVAEATDLGATGIILLGAKEADSLPDLVWFEQMLRRLHARFPALWIHGLSATEIVRLAAKAALPIRDTLLRLQAAGLGSISGNEAGILDLDDAVQTPHERCATGDWLALHRTAHSLGMPTTAAMIFGAGETMEHRLNHLLALQQLQQETGGFTAFFPTTFQPAIAGVRGFEEATAVEYLKMLAVSRVLLDAIPNLQADWAMQGLKVLQMALRFGANDVGAVMPGEALTTPDGTTEEDLRRVIRGAGFRPVQRDTAYRTVFLD